MYLYSYNWYSLLNYHSVNSLSMVGVAVGSMLPFYPNNRVQRTTYYVICLVLGWEILAVIFVFLSRTFPYYTRIMLSLNGSFCRLCKTGKTEIPSDIASVCKFYDKCSIFQLMGCVECIYIQLFGPLTYHITLSSHVFGSRSGSFATNKNGFFRHLCRYLWYQYVDQINESSLSKSDICTYEITACANR